MNPLRLGREIVVGLARKNLIESLAATRSNLPGRLFEPVNGASLAFFRIAFGGIILWEVWRHFDKDWVREFWVTPAFHFSYYGLDWIKPWPGIGMDLHWLVLGFLAICIVFGFRYRIASLLFFVGFIYVFLLDQALYLNHFYLVGLISFLLIFIPAHRSFSIDALLKPGPHSGMVLTWSVWLVRFQSWYSLPLWGHSQNQRRLAARGASPVMAYSPDRLSNRRPVLYKRRCHLANDLRVVIARPVRRITSDQSAYPGFWLLCTAPLPLHELAVF